MEYTKSAFFRYVFSFIILLTYLFLYIPIIVLILSSFNNNEFSYEWSSFSLRWYYELFNSSEILDAFINSLIVAITSVGLSIIMGLFLVFYSSQSKYLKKIFLLFYANLAIPEIVLAVGMLSFFAYFSIPLGLTTLIAGHTILGLGFVVPIIQAQFKELDKRYTEASLDLGATHSQTLNKVILPLLLPSLIAAGLLVFIISLDDFIISFFCAGASTQTLPMYIFSMIRVGASPMMSALSTLLLLGSSLLVLIFSSLQIKKTNILR